MMLLFLQSTCILILLCFFVRTALDNFGHLSDQDKSLLMSYPLQRLANVLTQTHEGT